MKKSIVLMAVLLFTNIFRLYAENRFYYGAKGCMNELSLVPNKLALRKNSEVNQDEFLSYLSLPFESRSVEWKGEDFCIIEAKQKEIDELKEDLLSKNHSDYFPIYLINNNIETIVLPEIVIKVKSSISIDSILSKHGLVLKEDKDRYQIYSVPKDSDVIKIANQIYETGRCVFSYPHFKYSFQLFSYIPNDQYFQHQIALHNTGQMLINGHTGTIDADIDAPEAWSITKGSADIVIAVFDEGVTSNHPDLPNSRQVRLNGSNFGWGNPNNPSPVLGGDHGNACAGVIAATMDNNEGITGIAPNCKIMPVKMDECCSDELNLADGISFAADHGANIISCSWGIKDSSTNISPVIIDAIENAIAQNVIVIFAAGNMANHIAGDNGYVTFPANANIANLITVGASDRYDQVSKYSPVSPLIDIVAPSHRAYRNQISTETFEMWSLDIPGEDGFNPIPPGLAQEVVVTEGTTHPNSGINYLAYTGYFGGTSHSCPVVAGVVALMLSVNPNLTPTEVFNILKNTSDKVGGYTYINGRCNEMGYGRVNAFKAVVEAAGGHIQGPDYVCDTTKYYLWQVSTTGTTINWYLSNAESSFYHYSIVGPTNQDTISVRCSYETNLVPLTNEQASIRSYVPTLTATITDGTSTETYQKKFRMPNGETPTFSASSSSIWVEGTPRTFTITNCTNVPDSALTWTVTKKITPQSGNWLLPYIKITSYSGRSITYTPTLNVAGICEVTITATNTTQECIVTATKTYLIRRILSLLASSEEGELHISVNEESEESGHTAAQLNASSSYTIELWHNIYGLMKSQAVLSTDIQIGTSNLPQGVYVLLLKENGEVVAQTKVQL